MNSHPWYYTRRLSNPDWDPARRLFGFESMAVARRRRDRLVHILRRGARTHRQLAEMLGHCRKGRRCGSLACPVCMRCLRRWFVYSAMEVCNREWEGALFVTVISPWFFADFGELHHLDLQVAKDRLRRQLDRCPTLSQAVILGGIDFSLNTDGIGNGGPRWSGHFHLIVFGATPEQIRAELGRFYSPGPDVPRPLHIRNVKEVMFAISYTLKSFFWDRRSFLGTDGKPKVKRYGLRSDAEREVVIFMDQFKPSQRIFLRNIRRRGTQLKISNHSVHENKNEKYESWDLW
jgi:hypothetical protein